MNVKKNIYLILLSFLAINFVMCDSMLDDSKNGSHNGDNPITNPSIYAVHGEVLSSWGSAALSVSCKGDAVTKRNQCDSSGNFTISDIPAGKYTLTPEGGSETFSPSSCEIEIIDKDVEGVRFEVVRTSWELNGKDGKNEEIVSAIEDAGDFVVVGNSNLLGKEKDIYVIKFSSSGVIRWEKRIGDADDEWAVKAVKGLNGGYYILCNGILNNASMGGLNTRLLCLDGAGNVVHDTWFGGFFLDEGADLALTPDGSALVAGSTTSFTASKDIFLAKFNSSGNLTGYRVYDNANIETA
ncbi:MAG TPA: hypothetical protein VF857_09695, partial [Spirochaetota bacterium]